MLNLTTSTKRRILSLLALCLLSSFNPISSNQTTTNNSYYVFFDLGDVLLEVNQLKVFGNNIGSFIKHFFKHGTPKKQRLFEFMDYRTGRPRGTAVSDGIPMPAIMCDWLEGKISSHDLVTFITNIKLSDKFFKSKTEARTLIKMIKFFLPQELVDAHRTTKMLQVFHDCCRHDAKRVCILSNWDKSSIKQLKAKFPEIFAKIPDNQIIFSGEINCKKPDADIYRLAAQKIGVNPCRCILVDDQVANVVAARNCGWRGIIHFDKKSTAEILSELYSFPCSI